MLFALFRKVSLLAVSKCKFNFRYFKSTFAKLVYIDEGNFNLQCNKIDIIIYLSTLNSHKLIYVCNKFFLAVTAIINNDMGKKR